MQLLVLPSPSPISPAAIEVLYLMKTDGSNHFYYRYLRKLEKRDPKGCIIHISFGPFHQ